MEMSQPLRTTHLIWKQSSEVEEDQEEESEEEDAEEDEETSESESVQTDLQDKVRSILDEFDNYNLKVIQTATVSLLLL